MKHQRKPLQLLRIFFFNTLNILVYVMTLGRKVLHEGRFKRGCWLNWNRVARCNPQEFLLPRTEGEISKAVKQAALKQARLRVVGGGHSFNDSSVSNDCQLSLDRYDKLLRVDASGVIRVQAGIRLRELNKQLEAHGLALPVLGSTDAQSLGGLIATDLHGTGWAHGFLSEQVLGLRIMDANGQARDFPAESDTCRAAMGGLGTCGIVLEAELRCVPAFRLAKSASLLERDEAEKEITRVHQAGREMKRRPWAREQLLEGLGEPGSIARRDHVSLYYLGGIDSQYVRVNTWERTEKRLTAWPRARKMVGELFDILFAGFLLGISRLLSDNAMIARFGFFCFRLLLNRKVAVYPSASAFARKLFYLHDELEYGIPVEHFRACLKEIDGLLRAKELACIIEVRFTPNQSQALLGPGVGRETCHIELAPGLAYARPTIDDLFVEAEAILLRYGGQPHLGKAIPRLLAQDAPLQRLYGERFTRFQQVRRVQDPRGLFLNDFARHILTEAVPLQEAESSQNALAPGALVLAQQAPNPGQARSGAATLPRGRMTGFRR